MEQKRQASVERAMILFMCFGIALLLANNPITQVLFGIGMVMWAVLCCLRIWSDWP